MKTMILLLLAAVLAAPTSVRAEDDLHVVYEEGRAAFHAGQFELAREKLAYVLSKSPGHLPTQAMMAQIVQKIGADNTMLRKSYEKVIIDKIEFTDVALDEALQAVRVLARRASNDKVSPNIIVKSPEIGRKPVSISLTQVPLSEVLNYLAQLTGARLSYDKAAVMFTNRADIAAPATPAPVAPATAAPAGTTPAPITRQALDRNNLPHYLRDPFARKS